MISVNQNISKVLYFIFYPLLYLLSLLFTFIIKTRHWLYDHQFIKPYHFPQIITICVGNLNFGGSGKSPLTNYLIQLLKNNYKTAVLSRGYGRKTKGFRLVSIEDDYTICGDEPLMYKIKHPEIIVAVCEDRVKGIQSLLQLHPELQIVILDDAFQHRKIKADVNILVTEYSKPFFLDKIFPLGKLRDIKSSAKRADKIIISKVPENTDTKELENIKNQIKNFSDAEVYFSSIEYQDLYSFFDLTYRINIYKELSNYNCILVTGIANPLPLTNFIKEYAQHFYHLQYPDHYNFTENDINLIKSIFNAWQEKYPPVMIITTEKDAVRMRKIIHAKSSDIYFNLPIFIAPIQFSFSYDVKNNFSKTIIDYVRTHSTNG